MRRFFGHIRIHFKAYLITFIVSLAIGLGIFFGFFFGHTTRYIGALDGTGVAALALGGISALMWIGKLGAFDSMSYGFKQMFTSMFNRSANKYNDFATYKEDKNTQRKSGSKFYFVSLFVASLFLIAFIVLEIVKSTVIMA